jgi:hypothetical protein
MIQQLSQTLLVVELTVEATLLGAMVFLTLALVAVVVALTET